MVMFDKHEPSLEVAGWEQRVVGWPKCQPVVELAPAAGLQSGPSKGASPAGMMGPVPSGVGRQGVALPAGLLSLTLLGNAFLHSERFYQRRDILHGCFLGGGGDGSSPSQGLLQKSTDY